MPNRIAPIFPFLLLVLPLIVSQNGDFVRFTEGGKRRIHITDDLDDVVDDEEDEAWKEWGKKSTPSSNFDLPPSDLSKMELSEIQSEMMKRHSGPVFGFVKLRLGVKRTQHNTNIVWVICPARNIDGWLTTREGIVSTARPTCDYNKARVVTLCQDVVAETAMKWTKVLRTGAIEAKFMGLDLTIIMFNMDSGQNIAELKEFVLSQPEAYEIKIGDQVFRRPGDPPLEEVVEKLHSQKNIKGNENERNLKEEL